MKKKKLFPVISSILGTVLLASCGTGVSTSFSANWYANTSINTVVGDTRETLTYSVTMKEEPSAGAAFAAYYTDGAYTTSLSTETRNGELLYSYTTNLAISVQFAFNGEYSDKFKDEVTSKVLFKNTRSGLQPIHSEKFVESHSPASLEPKSLATSYTYYKYSIAIDYNENCTEGKSVYTNLLTEEPTVKENSFSISDKYTYIDNEELLFAFRGVSFESSQQLQRNNSTSSGTQTQTVKATPESLTTEEFEFTLNGTTAKRAIEYYPVSISAVADNPTASQTAWYAKTTDTSANTYRNMLLRLEIPVFYNTGTLVYELRSAELA